MDAGVWNSPPPATTLEEARRRTAAVLHKAFRTSDIIARHGGDEFVIVHGQSGVGPVQVIDALPVAVAVVVAVGPGKLSEEGKRIDPELKVGDKVVAPARLRLPTEGPARIDLLERTIGADAKVELNLQPGALWACADQNQLELAILNRAINSPLCSVKSMMMQAILAFWWPDLPRCTSAMSPSVMMPISVLLASLSTTRIGPMSSLFIKRATSTMVCSGVQVTTSRVIMSLHFFICFSLL